MVYKARGEVVASGYGIIRLLDRALGVKSSQPFPSVSSIFINFLHSRLV